MQSCPYNFWGFCSMLRTPWTSSRTDFEYLFVICDSFSVPSSKERHDPSFPQPAPAIELTASSCGLLDRSALISHLQPLVFPTLTVVHPVPLCFRPSTELVTTQCHSCLKHLPEGLNFCQCGACPRPDEDTINIIQMRFKAFTVPHYLARINRSRRKKCGEQKWQTSLESQRRHERAVKHNENKNPLILVRWMTDEQNWSSQMGHGWTEAYCRYLDYLVSTSRTLLLIINDTDMRAPLR